MIQFYKNIYTVNYCAYGGLIKKPTNFWTTKELPGFEPKKCLGKAHCLSLMKDNKHYSFEDMKLKDREAIPEQLSAQIGVAIAKSINTFFKH